jgi:hypothetical protein
MWNALDQAIQNLTEICLVSFCSNRVYPFSQEEHVSHLEEIVGVVRVFGQMGGKADKRFDFFGIALIHFDGDAQCVIHPDFGQVGMVPQIAPEHPFNVSEFVVHA